MESFKSVESRLEFAHLGQPTVELTIVEIGSKGKSKRPALFLNKQVACLQNSFCYEFAKGSRHDHKSSAGFVILQNEICKSYCELLAVPPNREIYPTIPEFSEDYRS